MSVAYKEVWPDFAIDETSAPVTIPHMNLIEGNLFEPVTNVSLFNSNTGIVNKLINALQPGQSVAGIPSGYLVLGLLVFILTIKK